MGLKPPLNDVEEIQFIEELRELKDLKRMTYEQIVDKTEQNGERVSLSTVKLVFSEDKKHKHDYNNTLLPIYNALTESGDIDPLDHVLSIKLELLKANYKQLLEKYNADVKEYQERLKNKDVKNKEREQFYIDLIDKQAAEIAFKNEQIKHHHESINRKDTLIEELYSKLLQK